MEEAVLVRAGGSGVLQLQEALARGMKVEHLVPLGKAVLVITEPWYTVSPAVATQASHSETGQQSVNG